MSLFRSTYLEVMLINRRTISFSSTHDSVSLITTILAYMSIPMHGIILLLFRESLIQSSRTFIILSICFTDRILDSRGKYFSNLLRNGGGRYLSVTDLFRASNDVSLNIIHLKLGLTSIFCLSSPK